MAGISLVSSPPSTILGRKANLYLLSGASVEMELDDLTHIADLRCRAAEKFEKPPSDIKLLLGGIVLSDEMTIDELPVMCDINVAFDDRLWWYPWGKYIYEGKHVLLIRTHTWYFGGGFLSSGEQEGEAAEVLFTDGSGVAGDEQLYKVVCKLARNWNFNKHLSEERTVRKLPQDSDCKYEYVPMEDPDVWEEYEATEHELLRGERRKPYGLVGAT